MADSRAAEMVNRLRELQADAPDIIASALVTADGLSLASALPSDVSEDRLAAMNARPIVIRVPSRSLCAMGPRRRNEA